MNILLGVVGILVIFAVVCLLIFLFLVCVTGINNHYIFGKDTSFLEDVRETIDILLDREYEGEDDV